MGTGCGIHIHQGTSCDTHTDVGGHYWNETLFSEDPWNQGSLYNSLPDGTASGINILSNGFSYDDINGRAIVVHTQDGSRVGCGVISDVPASNCFSPLSGCISSYPEYDGTLEVLGQVKVEYTTGDKLKITYDLGGVAVNCTGCGIHIHQGTSCDTHADVGGHYWNETLFSEDPWNQGSLYNSLPDGTASGINILSNGFSYDDINGRAIVVHTQDGSRVGCGVISDVPASNCFSPLSGCISSYPEYDGTL